MWIRLLGPASVDVGTQTPARLPRKGTALLALLSSQPTGRIARSAAVALLWEGTGDAAGRHSLAVTLSRLRAALPQWPIGASADELCWQPAQDIRVDTVAFARHVDAARAASGPEARAQSLELAAAQWRGPFLEGFTLSGCDAFESWLAQQRTAWETRFLDVLEDLCAAQAAVGAWSALAVSARKALSVDAFQERFHRYLMQALSASGDRASALTQYATCRELLRRELGVHPSVETEELRARIAGRGRAGEGRSAVQPTVRPLPRALAEAPLVERGPELARVTRILGAAATGEAQVVLLAGEAGIGKSRLLGEAVASAGTRYDTMLWVRCRESLRELPFAVLAEALEPLIATLSAPGALPDVWLSELARILPDILHERPDVPAPGPLPPLVERMRLLQAMRRALNAVPAPVLVAMEDIQFGDEDSLRMLLEPAAAPGQRGLAVVATTRGDADAPSLGRLFASLRRSGRLSRVDLSPLSLAGVGQLAQHIVGARDERALEELYRETGGNPLLATELLSALAQGLPPTGAPSQVERALADRLGHLPATGRRLAGALAVFDGGVDLEAARQVAGLSEAEAVDAFEDLERIGLVVERSDPWGRPMVHFRHDVLRRWVLAAQSDTRRAMLHRAAFRVLARDLATGRTGGLPSGVPARQASWPDMGAAALHAAAGGVREEALDWLLRAATAARGAAFLGGAVSLLEQALTLSDELAPTPGVLARRAAIRLELATAALYVRPAEAHVFLNDARHEARAIRDARIEAGVAATCARLDFYEGRYREAAHRGARVVAAAQTLADERLRAAGLLAQGLGEAMQGNFQLALPVLAEAGSLHEAARNVLDATVAMVTIGIVQVARGNFHFASTLYDWLEERRAGEELHLAYVHAFRAIAAGIRGAWPQARSSGRKARLLSRRTGFPYLSYLAAVPYGLALVRTGDVQRGLRVQEHALALARQAGTRIFVPHARGMLALARLSAGDARAGRLAAEEALAEARRDNVRYDIALCGRALGLCTAVTGERDRAVRLIEAALAEAEAIGALPELARCHAVLSHLAPTPATRSHHASHAVRLLHRTGLRWADAHAALPPGRWKAQPAGDGPLQPADRTG